jgi:hypothetical protein
MTATHYTGKHGTVEIDTVPVTVVEFNLDIATNVINDPRVGKKADKKYPGKQEYTGTITQTLITPELLSYVVGDDNSLTTSAAYALLPTEELDAGAREEIAITNDPTITTSVQATLGVGDVDTLAGSIVIHGTDLSGEYVVEALDFEAMTVGDANQVVYGTQQFQTTDFVDVEANLEKGTGVGDYSTLKLDGITGVKTMVAGEPTLFDIVVKVEDANNNYTQVTLSNCFFTGGNFPVGDSDTLVRCDLPFVVQDADVDFELVWTTTV